MACAVISMFQAAAIGVLVTCVLLSSLWDFGAVMLAVRGRWQGLGCGVCYPSRGNCSDHPYRWATMLCCQRSCVSLAVPSRATVMAMHPQLAQA
jgi:hypothetical protein